jgi:predicted metal-binding membrane protein
VVSAPALESLLKRDRLVVAASLAALALLSWFYLFHLAAGMDMAEMDAMDGMPGMDMPSMAMEPTAAAQINPIVDFVLLAVMWMIMMVGMMVPSAAPTILLCAAIERKRAEVNPVLGRTALFVGGYFLVWGAFSIVAAAAQTALSRAGLVSMEMAVTSAALAGAVFVLAGLYEFTPLKNRCLIHCRSPLEWIPHHMRPGRTGALRMGLEHGAYCLGCCWVLMLLLFAGGVMNLLWVAVIAAIVLVQKLLPGGPIFARFAGAVFLLWGAVLIARPLLSL